MPGVDFDHDRIRPATAELIDVGVTPRVVSDADRSRGIGPIGFGYDPARVTEHPSTVEGPIEAIGRGFDTAWILAIQIPGGLADAVGGLLGRARIPTTMAVPVPAVRALLRSRDPDWLQLLIHPEIWVYPGETMRETMLAFLDADREARLTHLANDRIDLA